jgi:hypothetical protein
MSGLAPHFAEDVRYSRNYLNMRVNGGAGLPQKLLTLRTDAAGNISGQGPVASRSRDPRANHDSACNEVLRVCLPNSQFAPNPFLALGLARDVPVLPQTESVPITSFC